MTSTSSPRHIEQVRSLHVIPEDGIGGVELAARQAANHLGGELRVHFLKACSQNRPAEIHVGCGVSRRALDLRNTFAALRAARDFDPQVIVFSLWRTILSFLLMRLMFRDRKFVLFVHSDRSTHLLDHIATAVMARWSHYIWADSASALEGRLGSRRNKRPWRIISFVLHRPSAVIRDAPVPVFAYWGRLNKIKGIDRAVALFDRIAKRHPDARFIVIGPDAGSRSALEDQISRLGLSKQIEFKGPLDMPDIASATTEAAFYLQLSRQEGMAMSVVEAMQLGLVPVVSRVGAIGNYCDDGVNSIIFSDLEHTADHIEQLLDDPESYRQASRAAVAQWADVPLYQDDIIIAVREILAKA